MYKGKANRKEKPNIEMKLPLSNKNKFLLELANIKGIEFALKIINKSNKTIISLLIVGLAVHNALNNEFDLIIVQN